MGIEITTDPIEVVIGGTTVLFQSDPSASPAWDTLMDTEVTFTDAEKKETARVALTDALASMTETVEDADLFRKLDLGVATLRKVAHAYAREVTGFPTQPPQRSTKR